jgi:release factor glutamine methyltransferase
VTTAEWVREGALRLQTAGLSADEAARDASLLARWALRQPHAAYLAGLRDEAPSDAGPEFDRLIQRRVRREPIAYIIGVREFWGLEFETSPAALIPRPETELIVEAALSALGDAGRARAMSIADVGAGTGCLAVALAVELPRAAIDAVDISEDALGLARRNAARHGVADRIAFHRADLFGALDGPFDLVVSNPPYVRAGDPEVAIDVARYEPPEALYAGPDGLDVIRRLCTASPGRLRQGGWLIFEIGAGQAEAATALAASAGLEVHPARVDLQGIPRSIVCQKP